MQITIAPTSKQHEAWEKLNDDTTIEVLFGGAAGGGKSWLGCEWLFTRCMMYPGTKWFIARRSLKDIRGSTVVTFYKMLQHHKIKKDVVKYNGQDHYLLFENGSRIDLLEASWMPSDPLYERLGSFEFTGGWIEEAGQIDEKGFEALRSRIGRWENEKYGLFKKLYITCNPTKGWLYSRYFEPYKKNNLGESKAFIQSLVGDNPHIDEGYIENLQSLSIESYKQRLLFGNWDYDDDPLVLYDYQDLLDMWTNEIPESNDYYIIVDVAGMGKDKAVVGLWKGLELVDVFTFEKIEIVNQRGVENSETLEGFVQKIKTQYGVKNGNILFDASGIGESLPLRFKGSVSFKGGSSSIEKIEKGKQKKFLNLRSQCFFKLAELVHSGSIKISTNKNKDDIVKEMGMIRADKIDTEQPAQIEKKEKIVTRLGHSPDYADMISMRIYYELKPKKSFFTMGA